MTNNINSPFSKYFPLIVRYEVPTDPTILKGIQAFLVPAWLSGSCLALGHYVWLQLTVLHSSPQADKIPRPSPVRPDT